MIPFDKIKAAALSRAEEIVRSWAPGGSLSGSEYTPLNPTRPDKSRGSFSINLATGIWKDFATDEQGGDLISLYAYIHKKSQADAAKAVAAICGISIEEKEVKGKPQPDPGRKPDRHWTYHHDDGSVAFQVWRWDLAGGKKIVRPAIQDPQQRGKLLHRWPTEQMPLFDRHLLSNSGNLEKIVLLVEGETCMDAARALLAEQTQLFVTCWAGGSSNIKKQDWSALRGRKVMLLPDNDAAGRKAMLKAAFALEHEGAAKVYVLDPPMDKRKNGWDCADWDADADGNFVEWLRMASQSYRYQATDYEKKLANPTADLEQRPLHADDDDLPVKCIGVYRQRPSTLNYYFLSHHTGAFLTLTPSEMTDSGLLQLAPYEHWEGLAKNANGSISWKTARNTLMEVSHAKGHVEIGRLLRGRGVWVSHNKRIVVHAGDRMWDGKQWMSPTRHPDYIFERRPPTGVGDPIAATGEQLTQVYGTFLNLKWAERWMPKFLHGWVLAAPFCGLLDWRTHCVLTGSSGAGKTTIGRDLIGRCLGSNLIKVEGQTTEPGIRRAIGVEAMPVIFDENEKTGRSERAGQIIKEIMHLARVSSSESGGHIQHGDGNVYRPRSMFLFNWIDPSMQEEGDQNRFVVCELLRNREKGWQQQYEVFTNRLHDIAPDYWKRSFWWVYRNLDKWVETTKIFKDIYNNTLGSPRKADTLAPIYALSLLSLCVEEHDSVTKVPDYETAVRFLGDEQGSLDGGLDVIKDEESLLNYILNYIVRFQGDFKMIEMTVGEMISAVNIERNQQSPTYMTLKRWGVKVRWRKENNVCFSTSGHGINQAMRNTRWQDGWKKTLERIPGAHKGKSPMAFDSVRSSERYVALPIELCLEKDDYAE